MKRRLALAILVLFIPLLAGCLASLPLKSSGSSSGDEDAPRTFLNSDDYSDDDEIVGVFLTKNDYAKMVADFTYQSAEFDWGWVPGPMHGGKVQNLGFDLHDYSTVYIVPVENRSNTLDPNIAKVVQQRIAAAMKRLGLTVMHHAAGADLQLGAVVVDYNADHIFAYVTTIDPFVEIELRLKNLHTGKDLLLLRDQEHGDTPVIAAGDYASSLLQLLR